jgi:selenoprotein W-related protein
MNKNLLLFVVMAVHVVRVFSFQTTLSCFRFQSIQQRRNLGICGATIKDETGSLGDMTIPAKTTFHHVSIQYCTKCRWMLKSFWLAQELLSTFGKDDLDAVTIVPSFDDNKGNFAIRLSHVSTTAPVEPATDQLLWDRKERGGFPPPKDLKQLLRDAVNPDRYLGHSDTEARKTKQDGETIRDDSVASASPTASTTRVQVPLNQNYLSPGAAVVIHYCTGCQWMLRAAYLGQELLTTFDSGELKSVTLVPSKPPEKGGRFVSIHNIVRGLSCCIVVASFLFYLFCLLHPKQSVELDGDELFDRKTEGRFPEPKEIKQMIRDRVAPSRDLGHSDVDGEKTLGKADEENDDDDDNEGETDDDAAEEARRYFGVM